MPCRFLIMREFELRCSTQFPCRKTVRRYRRDFSPYGTFPVSIVAASRDPSLTCLLPITLLPSENRLFFRFRFHFPFFLLLRRSLVMLSLVCSLRLLLEAAHIIG